MKKRINVWKRKKSHDKGADATISAAPMHFHFSNAKCSFVMDESLSDTALTGCDLTFTSSTSTYSDPKSRNTANTKSTASRRSVDAPGLVHRDTQMHYNGSHRGSSYTGSHGNNAKREQKARLLSPSRLLVCHAPAAEWPPAESASFASRNRHSHVPTLQSRHHEKENNIKAPPNHHRQSTIRRSDKKPSRRQPHLYTDENDSFDSDPPPDFHPRKEIVDAIKSHEEMGRALSKLALNTQINDPNLVGAHSFTSTSLTGTSFETFSTNSYHGNRMVGQAEAGVLQNAVGYRNQQRGVSSCAGHTGDMFISDNEVIVGIVNNDTELETADSWSFSNGIEWSSSGCSQRSKASTKSDSTSFFQHVAFLEGLENHVKKSNPSDAEPMINEEFPTFFPAIDDLRSPPPSTAPPKLPDFSLSSEPSHLPPSRMLPSQLEVKDAQSLSPPSTPASIYTYPFHNESYRPSVNGKVIMQGIAQIKEETAAMLGNMESQLKYDLKELIEKEVVQIKSIVSERSSNVESSPTIKSNSPFLRSQFSPSNAVTRNAKTPPPQRTTETSPIDRNVLSEVLQKSLMSIESSILEKLKLHMDEDALQQRAYLEDMIDEKVTKVMLGQCLELQMAMGEIKRATSQAAKRAAIRPSLQRSQSDANAVITPARHLTPARFGTIHTPESDSDDVPPRSLKKVSSIRVLEDSFAETEKVIDDFVADCNNLVSDFDLIASRMEDSNDNNILP